MSRWVELFRAGLKAHESGDLAGAIRTYKAAIELAPERPDVWILWCSLGRALLETGQADEARDAFRQAIAWDPRSALAYAGLGHSLVSTGQLEEAAEAFRQSLQRSPEPGSYVCLGVLLRAAGKLRQAESCFREALRLDSSFDEAWYNLGVTLADRGLLNQAAQALRKAIALDPSYSLALEELQRVEAELSRTGNGRQEPD